MKIYYHNKVVRAVFLKHMSPFAVDKIIRYNFNTDFYGSPGWKIVEHNVIPFTPLGRHWYKPTDHVDQMDSEGVINTWRLHVTALNSIVDRRRFPPKKLMPMIRILGRTSHSITDIFAHSSIVELLYDFHRNDPVAKKLVSDSGLSVDKYLAAHCPTISTLLNSPEYKNFRTEYIPKMFSFQSIPDKGPTSHLECNLDAPDGPGSVKPQYPNAFDVALACAIREVAEHVDNLFEQLKKEQPEKYEALTTAWRDNPLKPDQPGPCSRRSKWWSDRFGGWGLPTDGPV